MLTLDKVLCTLVWTNFGLQLTAGPCCISTTRQAFEFDESQSNILLEQGSQINPKSYQLNREFMYNSFDIQSLLHCIPLDDSKQETVRKAVSDFLDDRAKFVEYPGFLDLPYNCGLQRTEFAYSIAFQKTPEQYQAIVVDSYYYPIAGEARAFTFDQSFDYINEVFGGDIQQTIARKLKTKAETFALPCNPSRLEDKIKFFRYGNEYSVLQGMLFFFNDMPYTEEYKVIGIKEIVTDLILDCDSLVQRFLCPGAYSTCFCLAPIIYEGRNSLIFIRHQKPGLFIIGDVDCNIAPNIAAAAESFVTRLGQEMIDSLFQNIEAYIPKA